MKIHSVTGTVEPQLMQKTMIHEHLVFDLSGVRNDTDSILENNDVLDGELSALKQSGCNTIIEVSNIGMGRSAQDLYDIAVRHDLIVVASTGFYKEQFYLPFVFEESAEALSEIFIRDIQEGMEGTSIKAGLISEIGSSLNEITATELKVFQAAILAHRATGTPISTHCEIGTMGRAQLKLFEQLGANLAQVSFGHQDLNRDIAEQRELLASGAYIQFDTVGKQSYRPDEDRADNLVQLLEDGFEDQLMLSCDITRRSHLKANGGYGYNYLFSDFIPLLKQKGVNDTILDKLLTINPRKFLAY